MTDNLLRSYSRHEDVKGSHWRYWEQKRLDPFEKLTLALVASDIEIKMGNASSVVKGEQGPVTQAL